MKNLIKNYTIPKVDQSILSKALNNHNSSLEKMYTLKYLFLGIVGLLFGQHLLQISISYIDILIGVAGAINIYLLLLINIGIGVIHFILSHPFLIMGGCFIYYIMNLYLFSLK